MHRSPPVERREQSQKNGNDTTNTAQMPISRCENTTPTSVGWREYSQPQKRPSGNTSAANSKLVCRWVELMKQPQYPRYASD